MNLSLAMAEERLPDGRWRISAPWLSEAVEASTYAEAYWEAVRRRHGDSEEAAE